MIEKQRLIDAADLIGQVKGITEEWTTDEVIDLLTFAPVIEARPIVHGHWIWFRQIAEDKHGLMRHIDGCRCSLCGIGVSGGNYCEECGAIMDEEGSVEERVDK